MREPRARVDIGVDDRARAAGRRRSPLRFALPLVLLAVAGGIGIAAISDHRDKQARIDQIQVADWHCFHEGLECGAPRWRALEDAWQRRQLAYELADVALGAAAVGIYIGLRRQGDGDRS